MKQWEDAIRPCLFYLAFCDFSSLERQFRSILHSLRCSDIVSRICYSGLSGLSGRHRFAFLSDQKREISLEQKKNDNCHNCQNREKQVRAFWWRGVHAEKSFSNQGVFPIIRKRRLFCKRCFASAPKGAPPGAAARAGRPGGQASRPTAKPHERAHDHGTRAVRTATGSRNRVRAVRTTIAHSCLPSIVPGGRGLFDGQTRF